MDLAFISHAHFDHIAPHRHTITSKGTAQLLEKRLPGKREVTALNFAEDFLLRPDALLRLHPAGHILGSAQLWVQHDNSSLLYSGDFKLRPSLSSEPCQPVRADVLIMETTYGLPQYVFPPTDQVISDILQFCQTCIEDQEVPILFGYSLGKSQELLSCLHQAGLPIMLHSAAHALSQVYQSLGVTFPPYTKFNAAQALGHVVIAPPNAAQGSAFKKIKNRRTAAITGWALAPGATFRYQCDRVFPLSDHAGFDDLLLYVEQVKPKIVYTLHGFANEFAATLRERGIESWSLTASNQLELPLPRSNSRSNFRSNSRSTPTQHQPFTPPTLNPPSTNSALFLNTCYLLEACTRHSSKNKKIELLAHYFLNLDSHLLIPAVTFLSGHALPISTVEKTGVGTMLLRRTVLQLVGLNRGDYRTAYLRTQDTGLTIQSLIPDTGRIANLTLPELQTLFTQLAQTRSPHQKIRVLQNLFNQLSHLEIPWAVKLLTGDFRAGLKEGLIESALAVAFNEPPETLALAHMITGDLAETALLAFHHHLDQAKLQIFRPVKPMLASPEPTAEAILERSGGTWWAEDKFDGIRCQLHKNGNQIELYSRDLKRLTEAFPELPRAAQTLPENCILDGELLAFKDGRALPFSILQKRLGRKEIDLFMQEEIPIVYLAFDCLLHETQTLIHDPWSKRREVLATIFSQPYSHAPNLLLAQAQPAPTAEKIEELFQHARQIGNEGLIIKDPSSSYHLGRRGSHWLKFKKAYATLDVVVTAVEVGHGKRKEFLSDYTFAVRGPKNELLTIGKAYSGLTDLELAEMTAHFKSITLEIIKGKRYLVQPKVVIEVAFDRIQPSDRHSSGLALRFPRILRLRPDKSPDEIDTLAHAQRLSGSASM